MDNNEVYGQTLAQISAATTDRLRAMLARVIADAHADGYTGGSWTENAIRAEISRRTEG